VDRDFDGEPNYDWKQALYYFDWILAKWLKEAGKLKDFYMVYSVGKNFRHDLYPDYKANRKDIERHPCFDGLKAEVIDRMDAIFEEGIEADDLIGIRCSEFPEKTLAISADKDFATIPCNLMIPSSHGRKHADWHHFTEDEANLNWLRQAMTGDTIDNYKGIPRVGIVGATKVIPDIAPLDQLWAATEAAFIQKNLTPEYALTMARVARILRHGDYDFETKKVTLWEPKAKLSKKS